MTRYSVTYREPGNILRKVVFATESRAEWFAQRMRASGADAVELWPLKIGMMDAQRIGVYRFLGGAEERAHRAELGW